MDDDLLADDGQYKDDGLDDLDIDEEAALLGLSDEEIDGRGNEELEYVDEDGNPVEIGENNVELYEVANIDSGKLSTPPEDDVLELDLDAEIESFTQENPDLTRESPVKTFNERQHKENLISLTSRNEHDKRRRDQTPDRSSERSQMDLSYLSQGMSSRHLSSEAYNEPLEYDEESEDESIADDHRERFKSERNIITLTPAKKRVDIPDTLESVISVEETAKVQAFLENEQKRKMRFKGKAGGRMKNFSRPHYLSHQQHPPHQHQQHPPHQQHQQHPPHQQPPHQHQPQHHQQPPHQQPPHQQPLHQPPPHQQPPHQQQFSPPPSQSYQSPAPSQPSRKILINPHFRGGVRLPLPVTSEQMMPVNPPPQDTMPPSVPYGGSQNYAPPMYSHHENPHQVNVSPSFNAPPPSMPYKPEYPPPIHPSQGLIQQPPIWQSPPEIAPPPVSYASPPPVLNYGDPLAQVPGYHNNYNQNNYQNPGFQNVAIAPPQPLNYNQPPPPVHMHAPAYNPPPVASVNQPHFQSGQPPPQNVMQQKSFHEPRNLNHNMPPHAQRKNVPPRFPRQIEKRPSNTNIKQVPMKVPRIEHQPRKNSHVNNSNIREIPLVDTVAPSSQKPGVKKSAPAVEEEDEKTKELRMKIEEQKLLREQILKRKEERRRQMAVQRMTELKQRQAEQNSNVISIQRVEQVTQVKPPPQNVVKASVKERIGIPLSKNMTPAKKKVIVVRKKASQVGNNPVVNQQKKVPIRQRVGLKPPPTQQPNTQVQNKPVGNAGANQLQVPIQTPVAGAPTVLPSSKQKVVVKTNPAVKVQPADNKVQQKSPVKNTPKQNLNQKGKVQQRLGNRGNFQRQMNQSRANQGPPRMMQPSPRFNGPRTPPHFDGPPFIEQNRMRFPPGPPMRMHGPPFQDRPHILPFHPQGEHPPFMFEPNHPRFRMQGPGFQNFRPPMNVDRFPPFPNQMKSQMFEPNGPLFSPRPRFQRANAKQRSGSGQNANSSGVKKSPAKTNPVESPTTASEKQTDSAVKNSAGTTNSQNSHKVQNVSDNFDGKAHSVSVENLSSSTSEVQLKKLCSSVGVVQNIHLMKDQRKAVVKFKEPSQALSFQKKYQRYMLDLAMIQVSLLPA